MLLRICTLIALLWSVVGQAPSEDESSAILEFHRKLRENVNPTASNMMLIVYSDALENYTLQWTANCSNALPDTKDLPTDIGGFVVYRNYQPPNITIVLTNLAHKVNTTTMHRTIVQGDVMRTNW
uniref:Secreted protein n=1 Tax=Mesocestoides corti TaxID=53468 RepID=A0A5K3FPP3_MESCO